MYENVESHIDIEADDRFKKLIPILILEDLWMILMKFKLMLSEMLMIDFWHSVSHIYVKSYIAWWVSICNAL